MTFHSSVGPGSPGRYGRTAFAAVLLLLSPASAQASLDRAFDEGFSLEVFEPAPAGDRFFAVADAASATDGRLRLGLVADYPTRDVIVRTDNATGRRAAIISRQLYVHGAVSYPITSWLHGNANVPFAAIQEGESAASPEGGALGDIRVGLRANVLDPESEEVAFGPGLDVWLPTGSEDDLTGDGSVRVNPRIGISGRAGAFVYTANVGYLVRDKVDNQSLEYGDAWTFGAGAGVRLFDDVLQVGPEIWGNRQIDPRWSDSEVFPVSSLFGAKVRMGDFVAGLAAGPGLSDAPGVAPRVVASLSLAPETRIEVTTTAPVAAPPEEKLADDRPPAPEVLPPPVPADSDGDSIADVEDACPDASGQATKDPKTTGCPLEIEQVVPPVALTTQAAVGAGDAATITNSGFQVFEDGRSRLSVFMTGSPRVEASQAGKKAEYLLRSVGIPVRNNKNPLLTRHFTSVVTSIRFAADPQPKRRGRGAKAVDSNTRLVVEMREAVKPAHRMEKAADGSTLLVIDFPKPTTTPPSEPDPVPPTAR